MAQVKAKGRMLSNLSIQAPNITANTVWATASEATAKPRLSKLTVSSSCQGGTEATAIQNSQAWGLVIWFFFSPLWGRAKRPKLLLRCPLHRSAWTGAPGKGTSSLVSGVLLFPPCFVRAVHKNAKAFFYSFVNASDIYVLWSKWLWNQNIPYLSTYVKCPCSKATDRRLRKH